MKGPEGDMPFGGRFISLDEPDHLLMTFEELGDEMPGEGKQTLDVSFNDADGGAKTEIIITQSGLMPEGMVEGLTHGYNAFMDYLDELLHKNAS